MYITNKYVKIILEHRKSEILLVHYQFVQYKIKRVIQKINYALMLKNDTKMKQKE